MVAIPRSLRFLALILCCVVSAGRARSLRNAARRAAAAAILSHGQTPDSPEAEIPLAPGPSEGEEYSTDEDPGKDYQPEPDMGVASESGAKDISYLDNDTGVFSSIVFQFKERWKAVHARSIDLSTEHLEPFHELNTSLMLCAVIRNRTALLEWLKMHADLMGDDPFFANDDPDPNDGVLPPQVLSGGCNITQNNAGVAKSLHIHLVDACVPDGDCAVELNFINDTFNAMLDRSRRRLPEVLPEFPVVPSRAVVRALYVKAFSHNVRVPDMLNKLDLHNDTYGPDTGYLVNGSFANTGDGLVALRMLMDSPDPDVHAEFTVHGPVPINDEKWVEPDISICVEDFMHPQGGGLGLQGLIDYYVMRGAPSVVRSMQLAEDSAKPKLCAERGFTIGPFLERCSSSDSVRYYLDSFSYTNWNKTMAADRLTELTYAEKWAKLEKCLNFNADDDCEELLYLEEFLPVDSLAGNAPTCAWTEEQAVMLDSVDDEIEKQDLLRKAKEKERQREQHIRDMIYDRAWRGIYDEEFDETDAVKKDESEVGRPAEDPVIEVEEDPDFLDGLDPAA